MKGRIALLLALLSLAGAVIGYQVWTRTDAPAQVAKTAHRFTAEPLNPFVMETIRGYPRDGSIRQMPKELVKTTMGVTHDLYYQGKRVAEGDLDHRAYCIGLMFEVYLTACENFARARSGQPEYALPGLTPANFSAFRGAFYGVDGNQRTMVEALVSRGLGKEIADPFDAEPGDFVQFWRTPGKTGHAVIFLAWEPNENGKPARMRFWSVQYATGASESSEALATEPDGRIDPKRIYVVRAYTPFIP